MNAFLMLASTQISRGSVDQAIDSYNRAIKANPSDVRIYVAVGSLLETRNQWQEAEDLYRKALAIRPDYALAANNLSYLMLEHGGDLNVAVSLAQTARKGMPDSSYSADPLVWAYYKQGVYQSAIGLFQEAIKSDAQNPTYHYHLGMTYQKANDFDSAKKQLHTTRRLRPNASD